MDIFMIRLLQFLLAIGLLVLLHEGGHFFFAKLFGIRVEKFYREFRHRTDEAAGTSMGVSLQASMATPVSHDWRCARKLLAGLIYLLNDSFLLGRFLHPRKRHDIGNEVQCRSQSFRLQGW